VLQLGRPAEDTFNALRFWRAARVPGVDDGDYLYVGGKFDSDASDGAVILDKVLHRVRVDPLANANDVVVSSTLLTYEDESAPTDRSESLQGIEVTATHVYASGGRNLTSSASHAGPCAGGLESAGIATVDTFAHPPTGGAFTRLPSFDSPPPPSDDPPGHDAYDAKSIALAGDMLFVVGQTSLPATAACGPETDLDQDDDLDLAVFTHGL
jgi:hypothetical protein